MNALITGSARGIGAAIAIKLAEDGYNIILNDISEKAFENNDLPEKIKALGVECYVKIADVSNYEQCEKLVSEIKQLGTIDVLVNNAGITRDNLLARMTEADYDLVINVNQKSVFNLTKLIGNVMLRQKSGNIVNVTSVAGIYGNAGQFNYSASKGALIAMTKTTAKELGSRGIRCNAVAPGFIRTPMTDKLTPEQQAEMLKAIALKRYGEVEDVANAVAFLVSKNAGYITGQIIEISGGLSM
ncbi:beta-ketoacyl-ACP reductase [Clostridia bacterium]|nr:beta-ketoacyl-ACP reductase [Clostridia bacterium]